MRAAYRTTLRTALVALVATGLAVVAMPESATALPSVCSSGAGNVTNWKGGAGDWKIATNWTNGVPDATNAVACVGQGTVTLSSDATVNQLHVDAGSVVTVPATVFLTFDGNATPSRLGGPGQLNVSGTAEFSGAARLVTNAVLNVVSGGVADLGDSDSFISADWGTATTIGPGGTLELQGDGGYYQGAPVSGQPVGRVTNNGTLSKSFGGSESVVDADYVQGATGRVQVDCCSALSFAGPQRFSGQVRAGQGLGTGACGPGTFAICNGSTNPAIDVMNVELSIPSTNPQAADVSLEELTQPPVTTDSRAIGNEVYAHADHLAPDPANPAELELRYSQADVMATPLSQVQVGHISDAGVMTQVPDCIGGALPPGAAYCLDRSRLTRTVDNTFITVLTTQTSRWRVRRQAPGESFDQTAPGAPQGLTGKLAARDGSAVALSWSAPAVDGGAAPTAYRIYRDGKPVTSLSGTSAVLTGSGPGLHTYRVTAVNAIGEGAPAAASLTLAKLSRPGKVKALRGSAGGKLTAGAKWRAPRAAGGFAITRYKVMVLTAGGKKVDTKVVGAAKHKYLFKLKRGRYVFKVRARNTARWGPWSRPTDAVRPR